MAEEAWALQYSDGSNNRLRVWLDGEAIRYDFAPTTPAQSSSGTYSGGRAAHGLLPDPHVAELWSRICLLYTSPSPRDGTKSRMPSSA